MYYVAYGSNMNLEQMKFRCPRSKVIGNGRLVGWKLVFNIHADVIRTKNKKNEVPVVLWDIHDDDWDMLDRYEGCPYYYIKQTVDIVMDTGEKIKAIVYVMTDERKGISPPSKQYFDTVLTGYNDNNINTTGLYRALVHSVYNQTEYNQYNVRKV